MGGDVLGSPVRNLLVAMGFVGLIFVLATVGFVEAGWTIADSIYMVTLTIFSVGYEEVHPLNTPLLRALDMATIILGCTGMIILTGALVQTFSHFQVKRLLGLERMEQQVARLSGHTIIVGVGRIGRQLAKQLAEAKSPFVIVEQNAEKIAEARELGYLCIAGDATDEDVLRHAGIERATALATVLPQDAANVFITLSARSLNPELEIIARGEVPATEAKLLQAGANQVVLPTHIGAEHMAEMILYPKTTRYLSGSEQLRDLQRGLDDFGLELEVVTARKEAGIAGGTVGEAERRGGGAFFIIRLERAADGKVIDRPGEAVPIEEGDQLLLILRGSRVAAGGIFNAPKEPARVGRNRIG